MRFLLSSEATSRRKTLFILLTLEQEIKKLDLSGVHVDYNDVSLVLASINEYYGYKYFPLKKKCSTDRSGQLDLATFKACLMFVCQLSITVVDQSKASLDVARNRLSEVSFSRRHKVDLRHHLTMFF